MLFPAISRAGRDPVLLFLRWQRQAVQVYAALAALADGIVLCRRSGGVSVVWDEWCARPPAVRAIEDAGFRDRWRARLAQAIRDYPEQRERWEAAF